MRCVPATPLKNVCTELFQFPPDIRVQYSFMGRKSSKSPPITARTRTSGYSHSTRRSTGSQPQHQMLCGSVYSIRVRASTVALPTPPRVFNFCRAREPGPADGGRRAESGPKLEARPPVPPPGWVGGKGEGDGGGG